MSKVSTLIFVLTVFGFCSCERHSWEDVTDADGKVVEKGTKRLFASHGETASDEEHQESHSTHSSSDKESKSHADEKSHETHPH